MKRFLFLLVALIGFVATGATITGPVLLSYSNSPYVGPILFRPLSTPLPYTPNLITGGDFTVRPATNGTFSVELQPGNYRVQVGADRAFVIDVPTNAATYTLLERITNSLSWNSSISPRTNSYATANNTTEGVVRTYTTQAAPVVWTTNDWAAMRQYIGEYTYTNIAQMVEASAPLQSPIVVKVLGYYNAHDGGGGDFLWDSTRNSATNWGAILQQTNGASGRYIALLNESGGTINVKRFGAKGDATDTTGLTGTDDTAAFQSAIDYAESLTYMPSLSIPPGIYLLNSITTKYASLRGSSKDGTFTQYSQKVGAQLVHKVGATGDMITIVTPGTATSPEISDLGLIGNREQNLKNPLIIASVTTRTNFVVTLGTLPTAPAITNAWPYYGYCFFYTDANKYLGAALVVGIDYGTGAISLSPDTDQYATATGSVGKLLTPGYKVCFSSSTTESASYKTTTGVDGTTAGYSAINIHADNASTLITKWKFDSLSITGFHTGIRVGNVLANFFNQVWIRNCTFAGYAGAFPGDNRDNHYFQTFVQGFYTSDSPGAVPSLENAVFQRTLWGFYGFESSGTIGDMSIDHTVNGAFVQNVLETRVGSLLLDGPAGHAIQHHGGQSATKRPQIEYQSVIVRNGNEASMVPNMGHPSYAINISLQQGTYYIDNLYVIQFGTSRYFDAVFNQPYSTQGIVNNVQDVTGATGETLYSAGTTSFPLIKNRHHNNTRMSMDIGGTNVFDIQQTALSTPNSLTLTGTGDLSVGNGKTQIRGTGGVGIDSTSGFLRLGADQSTGNARTDLTTKDWRIWGVSYTNSEPNVLGIAASSTQTKNFLFIGGIDPSVRPMTDIRFYTGARNSLTGTQRGSWEENGDFVTVGKHRFIGTTGPYHEASSLSTINTVVNGVTGLTVNEFGVSTALPLSLTGTGNLSVGNGRSTVFGSGANGVDIGAVFSKFGADQSAGFGRTDLTVKDARFTVPGFTNSEPTFGMMTASSQSANNALFIGGFDTSQRPATLVRVYTGPRDTLTGTNRFEVDSLGNVIVPAAGKLRFIDLNGPSETAGTGSPEGVVTAPVGSTYRRTDGGASTTFYSKESGSGNTGWVAYGPPGAGGVAASRQILTTHSLTGGGDLSTDRTLSLVNDTASPGNNKVYGTDGSGVRGWKNDPAGGGAVSITGTPVSGQIAEWTSASAIQGVTATGTGSPVKATAPTLPSTVTIGAAGGTTGAALFKGTTSGTVTLSVADTAGTYTVKLPTGIGTEGDLITTDGTNQLDWINTDGTGPVTRAFTSTVTDWTLYNALLDTPALGDPAIERAKFTGVGGNSYIYASTSTTTSHTNYLPTSIGNAKQLLNTDGSGQWSWVSPYNTGVAETTVASATTTDLGAVASDKVSITGTTTITGFGTVAAGVKREGRFTGALTLTHNATSLIIPGGASITTAAGDRFQAYSLGSGNWVVSSYTKADGTAVVGGSGSVATDTIWNASGDLVVGTGSDTATRLAPPTQLSGSTLYYGPNGVEWVNPATHFLYKNEFITSSVGPSDWSNNSSGGATTAANNETGAFGLFGVLTGTGTTGYRHQYLGANNATALGNGRTIITFRVRLPNLSDATDTYTAYVGFYDHWTTVVDGAFFTYSHGVNSGEWEAKFANNSSTTTVDSNVAASTSWTTFTLDSNAGATEVKMYINGSLVHTETGANIPGSSRGSNIGWGITKSAGTTSRAFYVDYVEVYVKY